MFLFLYQTHVNVMNLVKIYLLSVLVLLFAGCSTKNSPYQELTVSLNGQCPIVLIDDDVELTKVTCTESSYTIELTLLKDGLTNVESLKALDVEYKERLEKEQPVDWEMMKQKKGSVPFVNTLYTYSSTFATVVDSIVKNIRANLTEEQIEYMDEYMISFYPLYIHVTDEEGDQFVSVHYNAEQVLDAAYAREELLNTIRPIELSLAFSFNEQFMASLNEEVRFCGTPHITKENVLLIPCYYDAEPLVRKPSRPLFLKEVWTNYFNEEILREYLAVQMDKYTSLKRFFKACVRRGVDLKFTLEGTKDAIDYDLASPELIKKWESWGGNDTIVISSQELERLL